MGFAGSLDGIISAKPVVNRGGFALRFAVLLCVNPHSSEFFPDGADQLPVRRFPKEQRFSCEAETLTIPPILRTLRTRIRSVFLLP